MPDRAAPLRHSLQQILGSVYSITGELPGGGMSSLFLADDPVLKRQVVIKVLAPDLAGAEAVARFRQEIAIAVALQHPQIVPILASGEVEGLPYLIMPFVPGESLRGRLRRGPLSVRETVEVLQDVLRALAHAHEHGVIHRDIKPDNILLTASSAVVADFGIARALSLSGRRRSSGLQSGAPVTAEGTTSGTLAYMSPEQLVQDPALDHRSDLYALGIVAYEMLAGTPPFVGPAHQVVRAQVAETPPPLARRRAEIPAGLDALIRWCLAKDPAARPPSAKELLHLLQDSDSLAELGRHGPQAANRPASSSSGSGSTPVAARAAASVAAALDSTRQDLRLALRSLRRSPGLSLAAALTLALGIGANTAMFGVIDALFFRPPAHVTDPSRVVRISASPGSVRTWPRYAAFRDHAKTMAVAAYMGPRPASFGQGQSARSIPTTLVTADFFPLLGVQPKLGRTFAIDEDRPGNAADVAIVSEEFWRHEFDGAPAALGKTILVGQRTYTIIGVMPARFNGIDLGRTDIWLPMSAAAPGMLWKDVLSCEACSWLEPIGRLAPGITPAAAATEATALFRGHKVQRIDTATTVTMGGINQVRGVDGARGVRLSTWLAAACAIVLLIACVNVANLLLARAARRQREMAVRMALGSRRSQLVRQLYLESALLAGLGGAGALLTALWTGPLLRTLLLPNAAPIPLDFRVLAFTTGVVGLTVLLAGLAPALYTTSPDLTSALKTGAREGNVSRSMIQPVLLVGQIALTVVLLAGAGLFVRSLGNVRALRLGFDPDQVLIATPHLDGVRPTRDEINAELVQMQQRVRAVPGVTSTSLSIGVPFRYNIGTAFTGPGVDSMPDMDGPYLHAVAPQYFATLGTRLLRGRNFTEADGPGARRVLVVSDTFARLVWPGRDPIGQCLSIGPRTAPCREVVGVVENGRQNRVTDVSAQTFVPLTQADDPSLASMPYTSLLIRTTDHAADLLGAVQKAVQGTAPDLPFVLIEPISSIVGEQIRPWQIGATLFALFGGLALLLGAVGVYGVLSYAMSQRTHELGVRSALGAGRRHLLRLVMGRGLRVAVIGVVLGAGGALLAGRAVASLVYGISPYDPVVLGLVALILLTVSAGASFVPAWRATRIDPMEALREE